MLPLREAFFLGDGAERRFCLLTRPKDHVVGSVLYVHPFAEELNRSRRMASLAAMAFAQEGWAVLQMDGHGCGDSEGDFGDATWSGWIDDIERAHEWLARQVPGPVAVMGLRTGALLAANWLARHGRHLPLLAWAPVLQGKQYLTQFLRIRLGADIAHSQEGKAVLSQLRASLQAGEPVCIAGYWLSPTMAAELEGAVLQLAPGHAGPVLMLEVAGAEGSDLSPALENWTDAARRAGLQCQARTVQGQRFWQSQEVETAMALIPASLDALKQWAFSS